MQTDPFHSEIKTSWTADELLTTVIPEPQWVIEGFIPQGLSILGGRPKIGKSFLGLQLAVAIATGREIFGKTVAQGPVLYLALEDNPLRIQKRLKKLGAKTGTPIRFEFAWPIMRQGGLEQLERVLSADSISFAIIDTMSRVLGRLDQMDIADMSDSFSSLQTIAMNYATPILGIDHHRKPNGMGKDPIDDLMGSTGKSAPVDTVLGVYRDRGQHEATLMVVGRDIEEHEFKISWDGLTQRWNLIGASEDVRQDSRKGHILKAIYALKNKGVLPTITNIANHCGLDEPNVSHDLGDLIGLGKVVKEKKVGKQQPYCLVGD
jgi:hypothetical protein